MKRKARVTLGEGIEGGGGFHVRPTTLIISTLQRRFDPRETRIVFRIPNWSMRLGDRAMTEDESAWQEIDPFSLFSMMTFAATPGTSFEIVCEGERSEEVLDVLREFFTSDAYEQFFRGTTFDELDA